MKAHLFDSKGSKKSEIALPKLFDSDVREDIAQKYYEIEKTFHPYAPGAESGKRHSASGTISHRRHRWKGHYGKGISRVPRKTMWRRGTQFFWIGAEISSTRGGRRAHPPKLLKKSKRMNKKEVEIAMNSAFASTVNKDLILKRYSSIEKINSVPAVIESLPTKTKELIDVLKKIFSDSYSLVLKRKSVRAGKGKMRGRKYKSNAGLLIVVGSEENPTFSGVDIVPINQVVISDLYPLGRLTLYTKKAIEELSREEK
jgi:large subunit ribosomal protein L4e